jgi:hypothetical protein
MREEDTEPTPAEQEIRSYVRRSAEAVERFWRNVLCDPDGCWLWQGELRDDGYGGFHVPTLGGPNDHTVAHRYSYCLAEGIPLAVLRREIVVDHLCNVKACVRPEHLRATSQRANALAAQRDGLVPRGERHGHAKLTWDAVREIRRLYPDGWSLSQLAERYGVTIGAIHAVVQRRTWLDDA